MRSSAVSNRVLAGAICWISVVEYYAAQLIAQSAWPDYRISKYDVSALGATICGPFTDPRSKEVMNICSPLHTIMNAGFILSGALMIMGSFLTWEIWPKRRLSRNALLLIGLAGLGEILSGVAPGNVSTAIHAAGALLHWIFGTVAMTCVGSLLRKANSRFAIFSFLSSVVVTIAFLLYGNGVYLNLGRGGMQRMLAYPLSIWVIALGFLILARGSNATRPSSVAS